MQEKLGDGGTPGATRRRSRGSATPSRQASSSSSTPLLFALLGCWLDGRFGTGPCFAIVLGALRRSSVSSSRIYYRYQARMAREEEGKPWNGADRQP